MSLEESQPISSGGASAAADGIQQGGETPGVALVGSDGGGSERSRQSRWGDRSVAANRRRSLHPNAEPAQLPLIVTPGRNADRQTLRYRMADAADMFGTSTLSSTLLMAPAGEMGSNTAGGASSATPPFNVAAPPGLAHPSGVEGKTKMGPSARKAFGKLQADLKEDMANISKTQSKIKKLRTDRMSFELGKRPDTVRAPGMAFSCPSNERWLNPEGTGNLPEFPYQIVDDSSGAKVTYDLKFIMSLPSQIPIKAVHEAIHLFKDHVSTMIQVRQMEEHLKTLIDSTSFEKFEKNCVNLFKENHSIVASMGINVGTAAKMWQQEKEDLQKRIMVSYKNIADSALSMAEIEKEREVQSEKSKSKFLKSILTRSPADFDDERIDKRVDERLAQAGVQQKKKKIKAPRYTFGDLDPEEIVTDKNLDEQGKLNVLKANLVAKDSEKGKGKGKGKEKAAGGKGEKAAIKGGKGKHGEKGREGGKGSKGAGWHPKNWWSPPWGGGQKTENKGKSSGKGKGNMDSAKGDTVKGKGNKSGSKGKKKGGKW